MILPHNADGFVIGPDGFAESSADLLADFFAEHGDDPDEGPPESWPAWTDEIELDLGEPPRPTEQDLADYRAWCRDWTVATRISRMHAASLSITICLRASPGSPTMTDGRRLAGGLDRATMPLSSLTRTNARGQVEEPPGPFTNRITAAT